MTNESKNEADKLTTNDSSREITADVLNQVVGGTKQNRADGSGGGNVAGGWDLTANKVHT